MTPQEMAAWIREQLAMRGPGPIDPRKPPGVIDGEIVQRDADEDLGGKR